MKLLDSPATPADFVAALRRYAGIPHNSAGSFIVETATGPSGFLRCVGLPLVALRDIGFLPPGFPLDQSNKGLFSLLHANFYRVEDLAPGDVFSMQLGRDVHIAAFTEQRGNWGRYIHCLNDKLGKGRVWEADMNGSERAAIESIYRLKAWSTSNG